MRLGWFGDGARCVPSFPRKRELTGQTRPNPAQAPPALVLTAQAGTYWGLSYAKARPTS